MSDLDIILSTDADATLHVTDPRNRVSQSSLADTGTILVRRADGFEGGATLAAIREYMQDGLESGDNPQFASINLGHASDTTITRVSAGVVAVEGATLASQSYVDAAPKVRVVTETVLAAEFTDVGGLVGTFVLVGQVPAGAILLGSKVLVNSGFIGDVSCTLTIGDGSDVDRYMTGTPSIFATAANGIQTGEPSGNRLLTAANNPTLTITSATEISRVIEESGSLTVSVYYIATV